MAAHFGACTSGSVLMYCSTIRLGSRFHLEVQFGQVKEYRSSFLILFEQGEIFPLFKNQLMLIANILLLISCQFLTRIEIVCCSLPQVVCAGPQPPAGGQHTRIFGNVTKTGDSAVSAQMLLSIPYGFRLRLFDFVLSC